MKTKKRIMTVIIAGLFGISLLAASRPATLAAQPDNCGYGETLCATDKECVDLGLGWLEPIGLWLLGLVYEVCTEYFYYHP